MGDLGLNFPRIYEYRFRGIDQKTRQEVWNPISRYIYRKMGSPRKVLDPAAGRCEFLNAISAQERWVVDTTPYAEAFMKAGTRLIIEDARTVSLPQDYFDGVFVSNFLEHLASPAEVGTFLRKMCTHMAKDGVIAVMGPNFKFCAREYFDCADHILAMSHMAVEEHLYGAGFEVVESIPKFLPFSFRGLLPPSPALTSLYLRMPFAWRMFGKQFLILARKGPVEAISLDRR